MEQTLTQEIKNLRTDLEETRKELAACRDWIKVALTHVHNFRPGDQARVIYAAQVGGPKVGEVVTLGTMVEIMPGLVGWKVKEYPHPEDHVAEVNLRPV